MDIFSLIKEFNDFVECNPLTSGQIALWYALLYTNNKARWQEWFTVASSVLSNRSGLDRTSIVRARNVLKQKGLIDFRANGNQATRYSLLHSATADATAGATADASADATADASADAPINKTKTKTKTKTNIQRARFAKPTVDEVAAYCRERNNSVNPAQFVAFYESKGWMVGKTPMKNWQAAVRTWENNGYSNATPAKEDVNWA